MGKKYYCDYCDKSFSDNPTNRKNHARGVHHRQAKTAHYDFFKDAETQLREDAGKRPCRTFQTSGECPFGSSCRYSHMTEARRQQLENEVHSYQEAKKRKLETTNPQEKQDFDVHEWVAKRLKTNPTASSNGQYNSDVAQYEIPEAFKHIPMLPPSLIPPVPKSLENFVPAVWGS